MKKQLLYVLLLSIGYHACIYGQITISPELQTAIEHAWSKSTQIKNQRLDIQKLELQKQGAKNTYLPHVSATVGYAYLQNDLILDLPTKSLPILGIELFEGQTEISNNAQAFHAGLSAFMPLFTGMQVPNAVKALEHKKQGNTYLLEVQKDQLILELINSFDQLHALNQANDFLSDSKKRLDTETLRIEKAITLGLAIPYDRDKITYARLELESKELQVASSKDLLLQKIQYLTDLTLQDIDKVIYDLEPYFIDNQELNIQNKQEIKALQAYKAAQNYMLKKQKGSYLPTLGAFASVSHSSVFDFKSSTTLALGPFDKPIDLSVDQLQLSPNFMVGLALKWDIFTGFQRKHETVQNKIALTQLENTLADTKEKLELLMQKNHSEYLVALQNLNLVAQLDKVAQNNLTLAIKQYQQGLISVSERLEAENQTLKASLDKVHALVNQRAKAIQTLLTTGDLQTHLILKK